MIHKDIRLQNGSSNILHILSILFFTLTLWNCINVFVTSYGIKLKYAAFVFLILIAIMIIGFVIERYLGNKTFILLLFIIAFSIRYIWILKVNSPVASDFSLIYKSALSAAKGDFSFSKTPYFSNWVYQIGFTMYEALIIKLFGGGIFVLKFLNVLYSTGTTIFIYKIAGKLFNEWCGRMAGIIYAFFIPSILMSSVLTNQHLSTFLFYFGFYLLVKNDFLSKFGWIYIGILLSLGDMIRPLGSFIMIAVVIYLFINNFLGKERKQKITAIKRGIGILFTFYVVHIIISQVFIVMEVTQYPLSNRDPLWKFVLGLNYETKGQYSDHDYQYVRQFKTGKIRNEVETHLIRERIADKQILMRLFKEKLKVMWAGNDSSFYWSLREIDEPNKIENAKKAQSLLYISIIFFSLISLIQLVKNKSIGHSHLLFLLLILGYVAVHLIIEIQTRYRYFIIPSIVIIQSYGVFIMYKYCKVFSSRLLKRFRPDKNPYI